MQIGKHHDLTIIRRSTYGLYLADEQGEEVLLPNKYVPNEFEVGEKLNVFIYRDAENRKIATTLSPSAELHGFGFLPVKQVAHSGAFMDWGLPKDLLAPFKEQKVRMEEGKSYVARVCLDEETDRLFASSHIDRFLQNVNLTVEEGDQVDLLIYHESELGFSAVVNNAHKGLLYHNEIFEKVQVGDRLTGFVKTIREDHKLDLKLQPSGYRHYNDDNERKIMEALEENEGFLFVSDKSSPEQISELFGISKKAFKKAIGGLYKARKISLEKNGISLVK